MRERYTPQTPTLGQGRRFVSLLALGSMLAFTGTSLNASAIFVDDFSTGVGNWSFVGSGSSAISWDESSAKFGNSLLYTGAGSNNTNFSRIYAEIPTQTLAVGQSLSVSVLYHGLQYIANYSNRFILGFVDSLNAATFQGFASGIRVDARPATGAFDGYFPVNGASWPNDNFYPDKELVSGTPFNFNGVYVEEGDPTGNIDDIIQATFSITARPNDKMLLTATYLNLNTASSFTTQVEVESTLNTFEGVLIGYRREGSAAIFPSFEIGSVSVTASVIPEPGFYAAAVGLVAGLVLLIRRRRS